MPKHLTVNPTVILTGDTMDQALLDAPDLKPCPFCGRQPQKFSRPVNRFVADKDQGYPDGVVEVPAFIAFRACHGDGYSAHAHMAGRGLTVEEADAEADEAWNTRSY